MDIEEKEGRYRVTSLAAGGFIALLTIFFLSLLKMQPVKLDVVLAMP